MGKVTMPAEFHVKIPFKYRYGRLNGGNVVQATRLSMLLLFHCECNFKISFLLKRFASIP